MNNLNIAVYCGSNPGTNPDYATCARNLGTWIGSHGHTLIYGGSSVGLMGEVSRATLEAGGKVIGVEPKFFIDAGVAQHDLSELIVVDTMAERKAKMIELADFFIALPGGVGTLEEISEIITRIRLNISHAPCFFMNIDGFYEPMRALLKNMITSGFLPEFDHSTVRFPESVEEVASFFESMDGFDAALTTEASWEHPEWLEDQLFG